MKKMFCATALAVVALSANTTVFANPPEGVPFPKAERPDVRVNADGRMIKKSGPAKLDNTLSRMVPEGQMLMGYRSPYGEDTPVGFYRLKESCEMELLSTDSYTSQGYVVNQGWMRDGRICALAEYSFLSILDYRYLELNPFTGEILEDRKIDLQDPVTTFLNYLPLFYSSAYDPVSDKVYGYGSSETGTGYSFSCAPGNDPAKAVSVKTPAYEEMCLSMAFNSDDGYIYGVNRNDDFVKISTDGTQTVIMPTGMTTKYSEAGMVYMPERKKFLWVMMQTDYTYGLVEIDPAAKTLSVLGYFNDLEQFPFLFLADVADDQNPIKIPEIDEIKFDHTARQGTISYFVPTEYFAGGNFSGAVEWQATLDGENYSSGSSNAGDIVDVKYEPMTQGSHTFGFYVKQGQQGSPANVHTMFVGYGVPNAPANVKLTETKIEWDEVSRCADGGYLDYKNLKYHVYINDKEVGVTADTFLDYSLPVEDRYTSYSAKVVADNMGALSDACVSESIRVGKPWNLEASILPTPEEAAVCSAFDLNEDKSAWGGRFREDITYFSAPSLSNSDCDDYLFLPPMNFDDANVSYEISYEVGNFSEWYSDQRLAVYLHPVLDPREVETVIQEKAAFTNSREYKTYTQKFAVSKPGTYYISFYTDNDIYWTGLRVRNIHVRKLSTSTEIPLGVSNLKGNGAPKGELNALIDFDLPAKYISGQDIPSDITITAEVKCVDNVKTVSGKPGEHVSLEIGTAQGNNRIAVITSIDGTMGKEASVNVFTGIDVPSPVSALQGRMSADNLEMTLTWDKPSDIGENGYYVNPDDVDYYVLIRNEGKWEVFEELGKNVFEYKFSVSPDIPMQSVYIGIAPGTAEGRCSTIYYMSDSMGTPYTLPIREEFENANFKYGPIRILRPTEDYADAEWGVLNPRQLDESMTEESGTACYGRSEGPTKRGMLMLPKVNVEGVEDPGIVFNFWTGMYAADVTILAETYETKEFIEIGKVPADLQGWQTLSFPFPDEIKDHKWVAIYLDAYFKTSSDYALFTDYEIRGGVSGIYNVSVGEGAIHTGEGEIVVRELGGSHISVYSLDGRMVWSATAGSDEVHIPMDAGTYIVRAGQSAAKVLVR